MFIAVVCLRCALMDLSFAIELRCLRTYEIEEGLYVESTTAATPYDKSAETG